MHWLPLMWLMVASPGNAADEDPLQAYAEVLASGDAKRLRALTGDLSAPKEIRLQAALILLDRVAIGEQAAEPEVTVEVPSARNDLACDQEGKVVRRVPVDGLATLADLDVRADDGLVVVRGKLEGNAGRPLHYLLEGGSDDFASRYVVSMLGVTNGLARRQVDVDSELVRSVQILERRGAIIVVVNSAHENALRVDFQQTEDEFFIVLRLAGRQA